MTAPTNRDSDKFMLRLPDGMRDTLKEIASINGRSLNAEIVERLNESLTRWPQQILPKHLQEQVINRLPVGVLDTLEDEIAKFATERTTKVLNNHELSQSNLIGLFEEAIEHAPENERVRLKKELENLLLLLV